MAVKMLSFHFDGLVMLCSAIFGCVCLFQTKFKAAESPGSNIMKSYRHEERAKSHTTETRIRGDVRFDSKGEEPRRFDGPRRPRGGYKNLSYETESERKVHLTRYNDGLIIQVSNDRCRNSNASLIYRRGHSVIHPQPPLKSNFKSVNNGHPTDTSSRSRNHFETSGRQRSFSFREGLANIPEPSMLPLDWKPDASGIPTDFRFQDEHQPKAVQCGNIGRRGDWNRSSSARRGGGGGGLSNGGRKMRRRGGAGDDTTASFRVADNGIVHDRDNQTGERPRSGPHGRGNMRGSRSSRRGGAWRGATDVHLGSKDETQGNGPGAGEHGNPENLEDSTSTDDGQYQLTVDLKVDDDQPVDVSSGHENGREEHMDGGLCIMVEPHQETVDSSEEEEETGDSKDAFEAPAASSTSNTDGETSESSNEELEAVEVPEENVSQTGRGSAESGPSKQESAQKSSEETQASDDLQEFQQRGSSVRRSEQSDEGPLHESEVSKISEERMSQTNTPMEFTKADSKRKTPQAETPPEITEACSIQNEKTHDLTHSGPITPEESDGNAQPNQESGDCETSFESVPADESHNSSASIISGEIDLSEESVTPGKPEMSAGNVERITKEGHLESSISKDTSIKAEESPTE
ncbi:hypothetical protein ECG_06890 [Echinococcus granulosus]|nr:hypothetical protein ECG_06890 [Echinococcus granulosus]